MSHERRSLVIRIADWLSSPHAKSARPATPPPPIPPPLHTPPTSDPPAFAVIDVETTGFSPRSHRVLELAIVRVDGSGRRIDEWISRLDPEGPVGATHIHGITEADVRDAPRFRNVADAVAALIAGLPLVAHNARFDTSFLRSEFELAGVAQPWTTHICTMEASYLSCRGCRVDACPTAARRPVCAWWECTPHSATRERQRTSSPTTSD